MSDNNPFCVRTFFVKVELKAWKKTLPQKRVCRNNGGLSEGQQKHSYKFINRVFVDPLAFFFPFQDRLNVEEKFV